MESANHSEIFMIAQMKRWSKWDRRINQRMIKKKQKTKRTNQTKQSTCAVAWAAWDILSTLFHLQFAHSSFFCSIKRIWNCEMRPIVVFLSLFIPNNVNDFLLVLRSRWPCQCVIRGKFPKVASISKNCRYCFCSGIQLWFCLSHISYTSWHETRVVRSKRLSMHEYRVTLFVIENEQEQ